MQYQYDSILIAARLYKHVLEKNQKATGETMRDALLAVKEFELADDGKDHRRWASGQRSPSTC